MLDWRAQSERSLSNYGAALVAKYLWLRRHEPEIARRCRYVLYGKDFLLFRLTGAHLTDWSSGPDAAAWDGALLAGLGSGGRLAAYAGAALGDRWRLDEGGRRERRGCARAHR